MPAAHSSICQVVNKHFHALANRGMKRQAENEISRRPAKKSFQELKQDVTYDRQWDARFNVPGDDDLTRLVDAARTLWDSGRLEYILVGGLEIGDQEHRDDYQCRHVHVALIFKNRVTANSILNHLKIIRGHGYYLVPRRRDLPYSGWRDHHVKTRTKVDPLNGLLYESGVLPTDTEKAIVYRSEREKKLKTDDILREIREQIEKGATDEELFQLYPRNFLTYGERIKAIIPQKLTQRATGEPHIWLWGIPGTGKTQLLNFLYPNYYKKNLHNKFFDGFQPQNHKHIMLEDVDPQCIERLTPNFFKTLTDEVGSAIDVKYKSPNPAVFTVLVTSNFAIADILDHSEKGFEETQQALGRRFMQINIFAMLRFLGLKLINSYDRRVLHSKGNTDSSLLFMDWDYLTDGPTGKPIKSREEYRDMIKNYFYNL